MLQNHLDGKKHAAKIKLLGGPEAFAPPKPLQLLGPLPESPAVAAAAAATPAAPSPPVKKPKMEGETFAEFQWS